MAAVSLSGFLAGRWMAPLQKPGFKIGFDDADTPPRELNLCGTGPFGEQTLKRAANDSGAECGLIE
jgi:hypothetical protein